MTYLAINNTPRNGGQQSILAFSVVLPGELQKVGKELDNEGAKEKPWTLAHCRKMDEASA